MSEILSDYASAMLLREQTRITYAKNFTHGLMNDKSVAEKINDELNEAPEGRVRVIKDVMKLESKYDSTLVVIEEYEKFKKENKNENHNNNGKWTGSAQA